MTTRAEAEGALRAGLNAELGAANPYSVTDRRALARLWMRAYKIMLTITSAMLSSRQRYLRGRASDEASAARAEANSELLAQHSVR